MKSNRIRFDVDLRADIEAGKYKIKTNDGRDVEILKWDYVSTDEWTILGLVDCGIRQRVTSWNKDGIAYGSGVPEYDLFLYPVNEASVIEKLKAYFDGATGEEARRKFSEILNIIGDKLGND